MQTAQYRQAEVVAQDAREAFGDNLAITGHSLGGGLLLQHGADPNAHNGVTRATPLVSALMGKREKQFHDPDQAVTPDVRRGREAVRDWLRRHHVPIEDVSAR